MGRTIKKQRSKEYKQTKIKGQNILLILLEILSDLLVFGLSILNGFFEYADK
jgi:hypothetical protein